MGICIIREALAAFENPVDMHFGEPHVKVHIVFKNIVHYVQVILLSTRHILLYLTVALVSNIFLNLFLINIYLPVYNIPDFNYVPICSLVTVTEKICC